MKITTIIGARPQFIKAAAVSRAIEKHNRVSEPPQRIEENIIHTGQHFDTNMSDIFFRELQIPKPDFYLGVNSMSHGAMTGRMLEKIEQVLYNDRPDCVLVYGDTNSTLAGALAAAKIHIPIAHVEAGLRSFNRHMPEEMNRVMVDHLSTLLFCPTQVAVDNLKREGIRRGLRQVGDVMLDAFLFYQHLTTERISEHISKLDIAPSEYCLATVHREENTDAPAKLQSILSALLEIGSGGKPVLLPLHPRTRKKIMSLNLNLSANSGLLIIDPVGYVDMIALETHAFAIFTDSGGVQKEAFFSRVPCITLREETEWIETVECGWNSLVGSDKKRILNAYSSIKSHSVTNESKLYGDGRSAEKIIFELLRILSLNYK